MTQNLEDLLHKVTVEFGSGSQEPRCAEMALPLRCAASLRLPAANLSFFSSGLRPATIKDPLD